jgi:hypothetical protein
METPFGKIDWYCMDWEKLDHLKKCVEMASDAAEELLQWFKAQYPQPHSVANWKSMLQKRTEIQALSEALAAFLMFYKEESA